MDVVAPKVAIAFKLFGEYQPLSLLFEESNFRWRDIAAKTPVSSEIF